MNMADQEPARPCQAGYFLAAGSYSLVGTSGVHVRSQARDCHVVAALPHESTHLFTDIVESEPWERLVATHQLSNFQKAERLFQMPALGSRKLLELMLAILETCPRGGREDQSIHLHLPAVASAGDPCAAGQSQPQGSEDAGKTGRQALGPPGHHQRRQGRHFCCPGESESGFCDRHLGRQTTLRRHCPGGGRGRGGKTTP